MKVTIFKKPIHGKNMVCIKNNKRKKTLKVENFS